MRYGHQPISEIMALSLDDLSALVDEIIDIVNAENATGSKE